MAERTTELRRSETYLVEAQRLSRTGSWAFNVASRELIPFIGSNIIRFSASIRIRGYHQSKQFVSSSIPRIGLTRMQFVRKALSEGKAYKSEYRIFLSGWHRQVYTHGGASSR